MDEAEGARQSSGTGPLNEPVVGSCHAGVSQANALTDETIRPRRVLMVLGKKPARGQAMHPHFQRNLARAAALSHDGGHDALVITGGPTRYGMPSEAELGAREVAGACTVPILLEKDARTTSENVRFVRDMLAGLKIERITVVTSTYHVRRTRYLLEHHWPEIAANTAYESGAGTTSVLEWVLNLVYLGWSRLDPDEQTLVRLTKRMLRNGGDS